MAAKRRLDINASYGCSLICRFCFHLGIAGDMEYVQKDGQPDVRFGYKRAIRYHSPRYVVELVKYARSKFEIDFVSFLDENLMTMHQSSGKTWLTDIARLWIEEGLQPQCVRDGVPHDPERCSGIHWGGTSHATLCSPRSSGDQGGRLLAPALRLRDVLGARDEDDRQGRDAGNQRAVTALDDGGGHSPDPEPDDRVSG